MICCEQDATLLKDRNRLFKLAREKADSEGYQYKKRKSRSTVFGNEKETKGATKHLKLVTEERQKRTLQLTEDIKGSMDTIKLLELQREKFVNAEKYLQAAEVVTQISECRTKLRRLQAELTKLQKADVRSKKYHKGKSASKSKSLNSFTIHSPKASPMTSATDRSSGSTSTELESDVDIQDGLHERSEECIEVESASTPVVKRGEQRIDTFAISSSIAPPVTSVDDGSSSSTRIELQDRVTVQAGLYGRSEECIEIESASILVAERGEQFIAISSSKGYPIASEACRSSGSSIELQGEITVQEVSPVRSEEQNGSLQTNQSQDDQSADALFARAPQTM